MTMFFVLGETPGSLNTYSGWFFCNIISISIKFYRKWGHYSPFLPSILITISISSEISLSHLSLKYIENSPVDISPHLSILIYLKTSTPLPVLIVFISYFINDWSFVKINSGSGELLYILGML